MFTSLTLDEQEVHINFSAQDDMCEIYSSYTVWINRLKKKVEENPKEFIVIDETPVSIRVKFPLKYLKIRTKPRYVSDEQRENAKIRFQEYWKNKKILEEET